MIDITAMDRSTNESRNCAYQCAVARLFGTIVDDVRL